MPSPFSSKPVRTSDERSDAELLSFPSQKVDLGQLFCRFEPHGDAETALATVAKIGEWIAAHEEIKYWTVFQESAVIQNLPNNAGKAVEFIQYLVNHAGTSIGPITVGRLISEAQTYMQTGTCGQLVRVLRIGYDSAKDGHESFYQTAFWNDVPKSAQANGVEGYFTTLHEGLRNIKRSGVILEVKPEVIAFETYLTILAANVYENSAFNLRRTGDVATLLQVYPIALELKIEKNMLREAGIASQVKSLLQIGPEHGVILPCGVAHATAILTSLQSSQVQPIESSSHGARFARPPSRMEWNTAIYGQDANSAALMSLKYYISSEITYYVIAKLGLPLEAADPLISVWSNLGVAELSKWCESQSGQTRVDQWDAARQSLLWLVMSLPEQEALVVKTKFAL